ncbi:hypothetical protein PV08_07709 [Exophiala spinifera]|uniref:Zn(2)-C6 fungal-type domain-containing protein n=1 Tax=Exophiala spinifera TaxID=91928 RepID=A0A0D2B7R2_9EURO|nr:uncharacterized protein PV08_07709 [Exophiala spinifera]KIW14923.1 hypothetical protein PV08_07709 [Exophiala spinifera]
MDVKHAGQARRVKCDAAKPHCQRCTSTGQLCEYATDRLFRNTTSVSSTELPAKCLSQNASEYSPTHHVARYKHPWNQFMNVGSLARSSGLPMVFNAREHQLFHLFRTRIAPNLGGYFDADFWNVTLPCVAHVEPPVLYAALAVAATEKAVPSLAESGDTAECDVIMFYNRAIQSLRMDVAQHTDRFRHTILLTCLLFICLEFKRGRTGVALAHLQAGLTILCVHHELVPELSQLSDLLRKLDAIFHRLSIQGSLIGQVPPARFYRRQEMASGSIDANFTDIMAAQKSLTSILIDSLRPAAPAVDVTCASSPNSDDVISQSICVRQLRQWNLEMKTFLSHSFSGPNNRETLAVRCMQVQSLVATIWTSANHSSNQDFDLEIMFDYYVRDFQTLVSLAAICINGADAMHLSTASASPNNTHYASFSFEMGLSFALYFTAVKCRSPSIRRRAIELLSKATTAQEGLWNTRVLLSIARFILKHEESFVSGPPSTENPKDWPRLEDRIHAAYIIPFCDLERRLQQVQYVWRPGQAWETWTEDILF